ncbi:MAG: hypothetical protein A4E72_01454 [Syntrophus sp. PtaU1.Bin208]|nr:MAG: hypothetical protein A4E72_01454 [Syntrophus sp. PtaU1.Bin208]
MPFVDGIVSGQSEMGIDPEGDAGFSRLVGNHGNDRALEDLRRVEDVVDLLALDQAVGVNARSGHVEIGTHERHIGRDSEIDLVLEILSDIGDDRRVDPVRRPHEADIFHNQSLDGRIAGALAQPQKG